MKRLEATPLKGFNETRIDEPTRFHLETPAKKTIDYLTLISNTPAVTSSYDGLNNSQTVIGSDYLPHWDETELFPVGRSASFHGRNLHVLGNAAIEDKFGNEYRCLSIKGSDFSNPHIFQSLTAERDYIVYGLQESLVIERILRASRHLRAHNVPTEYILGLALPETFPLGNDHQPLDIKSGVGLSEFLDKLSTQFAQNEAEQSSKSPLEIKAEMIDRLKDCDYLISYRAMDCPYRLGELTDRFEDFKEFIIDAYKDAGAAEHFNLLQNVLGYIFYDFAPALASNVAKMHNSGITHNFLHIDNLTALGSIVDLDSCKGEPLGDEPCTQEGYRRDVLWCLESISKAIGNEYGIKKSASEPASQGHHEANLRIVDRFIKSYIQERSQGYHDQIRTLAKLLPLYKTGEEIAPSIPYNRTWATLSAYEHIRWTAGFSEPDNQLVGLPEIDELKIPKNQDFLSTFPTKYLKDIRSAYGKLCTDFHELRQAEPETHTLLAHPLRKTLEGIVLHNILLEYQKGRIAQEFPEEIFLILGSFFIPDYTEHPARHKQAGKANQYMKKNIDIILKELTEEVNPSIYHPLVKKLLAEDLSSYKDAVSIFNTKEEFVSMNIFWLESKAEYKEVFDAFGINESTPITTLNDDEEMSRLSALAHSHEPVDMVWLMDPELLPYNVPFRHSLDLLISTDHNAPMVLVDIDTDTPKILVCTRQLPGSINLELLLRELKPKSNHVAGIRLFEPDLLDS